MADSAVASYRLRSAPELKADDLPPGITPDDVVEALHDRTGRVVDALTWETVLSDADEFEAAGDSELAADVRDAVADRDREWLLNNVYEGGWAGDPRFADRGRDDKWVRAFVPRPAPSVKPPRQAQRPRHDRALGRTARP